jgi:PAS domain-containing protein
MKTVCAWCSKILVADEAADALVSHGICPECLNRLLGPTKLGLAEFLNSIELPVLVTDETRAIRQVNHAAERTLGKLAGDLDGSNVGMAIECLHAGVMGECGVNAYCAGCAFRRNINDTHADGKPRYGEYAQHNVATATGMKATQFQFSTTKMGDMVLLAIEGLQEFPEKP